MKKSEPENLVLESCIPDDLSLPRPPDESSGVPGVLTLNMNNTQYWMCPACERIYDHRDTAYHCCAKGARRVTRG